MSERFPDLPDRMAHLPVDDRGFPVPWFVPWKDGKPIFPAMDHAKWISAIRANHCWVCGGQLGRFKFHVIGPMGLINGVSAEPPSHRECANFAARHCPYIANPRMGRVPAEKHGTVDHPGTMDQGNPGVWCVIECQGPVQLVSGKQLIKVAPIANVDWWAMGRKASPEEARAGFEERAELLSGYAAREPRQEQIALARRIADARDWLPKEIAA